MYCSDVIPINAVALSSKQPNHDKETITSKKETLLPAKCDI